MSCRLSSRFDFGRNPRLPSPQDGGGLTGQPLPGPSHGVQGPTPVVHGPGPVLQGPGQGTLGHRPGSVHGPVVQATGQGLSGLLDPDISNRSPVQLQFKSQSHINLPNLHNFPDNDSRYG